jgi:endoglucanase
MHQNHLVRKRLFLLSFLLLAISASCSVPAQLPPQPTETSMPPTLTQPEATVTPDTQIVLQRGVNLGNMLEAPNEGEWGLTVQEEYFDLIKDAGFDFVRLPVRWSAHAAQEPPYTIDPSFFKRIDQIVNWALDRDLAIIVNLHHYEEIMQDPQGNRDRYLALWRQLGEHYKDAPPGVLFELLNEPFDQLSTPLWNEYLAGSLAIVRETNPERDVIVGPVGWNAYDQLPALEIPADEHLIVTFHYYLPFHFTHQGAEWVDGSRAWMGTTWDATEAETSEIASHFDSVQQWAKEHNVRVLLGEFGAYSKAPRDSRVRWTEFVRSEAERHGFAWSYWEFGSGFGAFNPATRAWRQDLLNALIPPGN